MAYLVRRNPLLVALTLLGLAAAVACNSNKLSNAPQNQENQAAGNANDLIGAGSTFVYPILTRWARDFMASHAGVKINDQSIGSGGGIQQLKQGLVDFGASDAPLDDQQLKDMPPLVQIPESAGPVCITYNLPDVKSPLRLSGSTLAGIYLGKIKTWQDAAIKKDNPGLALPAQDIIVAHRSDGSGTTNIFTTYLASTSPDWAKQVGKGISVKWPAGLGGKGSEGVTGIVKQSPGGIGYVELSYAQENHLPVAAVLNQAGAWVQPTAAAASAAINAFSAQLAKDVRTPIVNPPAFAKDAYPISGLTFLLVPNAGKNAGKTQVLKEFITYVVTQGQDRAEALFYAKLPNALQKQDEELLSQIGAGKQQGGTSLPPNNAALARATK